MNNEEAFEDNIRMNTFFKCGIAGWCMEVLWTGMLSCWKRDKKMVGNTSILMFPIYGMMAFLKPVAKVMKDKNIFIRGGIYALCIYMGEFFTGSILKKRNMCPWDYSDSKYNIKGIIRLDFLPAWFGAGLLFERLFSVKNK